MLESGQKLCHDVLKGMLQKAAVVPGLAVFAAALKCCVLGCLRLDVEEYAKLLGALMFRHASPAQVRVVLNMALPEGAEPIPLIPSDASPEEVRAAFDDGHLTKEASEDDKGNVGRSQAQSDLDSMQALSGFDLRTLVGMVDAKAGSSQASYFGHFVALMHLERLKETEGYHSRMSKHKGDHLAKLGYGLQNLEVCGTYGRKDSRRGVLPGWVDGGTELLVFSLPQQVDTERLRFRRGDTVLVSRGDPLRDRVGEGTVMDLDRGKLVVSFAGRLPNNGKGVRWRLDAYANLAVYERQLAALLQLATKEKPEPICRLLIAGGVERFHQGNEQGHSSGNSTVPDKRRADVLVSLALEEVQGAVSSRLAAAREEAAESPGCNASQRVAIEDALGRRCTVVQGPPGTGKTHVAVRILQLWAKRMGISPVLATSDSNVAVDNVAEGLTKAGVKVVRVGRPEKIRGHLEDITLDALLTQDKARREQENAAERGEERHHFADRTFDEPALSLEQQLESDLAQKRRQGKEDYVALMRILTGAEVICATTSGAGGEILANFSFKGMLIDEVAQATEVSTIVPIALRGAQRLVLVGDQCQLPPAVASREAERRGLSMSLFTRVIEAGLDPHFLDTQYRSHPKLAEFSTQCFYHGKLRTGIPAAARPLPHGISWPNHEVPIVFVETAEPEMQEGESRVNQAEAQRVVQLVAEVLRAGELGPNDIGVMTPYSAQVRVLRRLLQNLGVQSRGASLETSSVDAFQGREKELIFFSAVRCNPSGNVGFLSDWRRLNVMLTRARRGLVIVGSAGTLINDRHWQQWLLWYQQCVLKCSA
eukprot:TRINITY_DN21660_c1_g2_i1.p1 TRINITY_DN21660_c1_g2~~TRINITY_DN21660_c1_g2_i1.p1  ORF type:complete len:927 (+),score=153.31 TRINITY_DN21660_c1_g2_i1:316-2781(+)